MNISPKPQELIQSQVAAYAESQLPDNFAADAIYRNIGQNMIEMTQQAESGEQHQDYVQFLRFRSQDSKQAAEKESIKLAEFSKFDAPLQQLCDDITAGKAVKLGAGRSSTVYELNANNERHAVRFVNPRYGAAQRFIHDHIAGGVAGDGIEGLEQIETASYQQGIVISKFVEGNRIADMSADQIKKIPQDHLAALLETRIKASERGIKFDAIGDNTLYDPSKGFTDIDYAVGGRELSRMDAVVQVFNSLSLAGAEDVAADDRKAEMGEKKVAIYGVIGEYVRSNFSEEEQTSLLKSFQMARALEVADARLGRKLAARDAQAAEVI